MLWTMPSSPAHLTSPELGRCRLPSAVRHNPEVGIIARPEGLPGLPGVPRPGLAGGASGGHRRVRGLAALAGRGPRRERGGAAERGAEGDRVDGEPEAVGDQRVLLLPCPPRRGRRGAAGDLAGARPRRRAGRVSACRAPTSPSAPAAAAHGGVEGSQEAAAWPSPPITPRRCPTRPGCAPSTMACARPSPPAPGSPATPDPVIRPPRPAKLARAALGHLAATRPELIPVITRRRRSAPGRHPLRACGPRRRRAGGPGPADKGETHPQPAGQLGLHHPQARPARLHPGPSDQKAARRVPAGAARNSITPSASWQRCGAVSPGRFQAPARAACSPAANRAFARHCGNPWAAAGHRCAAPGSARTPPALPAHQGCPRCPAPALARSHQPLGHAEDWSCCGEHGIPGANRMPDITPACGTTSAAVSRRPARRRAGHGRRAGQARRPGNGRGGHLACRACMHGWPGSAQQGVQTARCGLTAWARVRPESFGHNPGLQVRPVLAGCVPARKRCASY